MKFCKVLLNLNNNSSEVMNVMHKSVTKVHGIKLTETCQYALNKEDELPSPPPPPLLMVPFGIICI